MYPCSSGVAGQHFWIAPGCQNDLDWRVQRQNIPNESIHAGRAFRSALQEEREQSWIESQISQYFFPSTRRVIPELPTNWATCKIEAILSNALLQRLGENLASWGKVSVGPFLYKPRHMQALKVSELKNQGDALTTVPISIGCYRGDQRVRSNNKLGANFLDDFTEMPVAQKHQSMLQQPGGNFVIS